MESPTETLQCLVRQLQLVFIFGGDICHDKANSFSSLSFRSLRGTEKDASGSCPSYERVQAAAAIWHWNPQLTLVPSEGKSNFSNDPSAPAISTVMCAELEQLGVSREKIIEENQAFNTKEQVLNCAQLSQEYSTPRTAILSPFYQFPRISALIHILGKTHAQVANLKEVYFLSMERILMSDECSESWMEYFQTLYAVPEMRETFAKDLLGTAQIYTGFSPFFAGPYRGLPDPLAL